MDDPMRPLVVFASLLSLPLAVLAEGGALPVFPPGNVQDTFFGTTVADPYRALESEKDPQVAAWMKTHADHAHRTIEGLKGYDALKARITELDNATAARIGEVHRRPGGFFFTRRGKEDNVFKLYVMQEGKERLLVDPEDWQKETGKPHAINYFEPSPDAKLVAVGISPGGNELASLYVIETATGKRVEGPIDRARYSGPQWLPDSKSFFYARVPVLAAGAPMSEVFKNRRTYVHVVGTPPEKDVLLLGP